MHFTINQNLVDRKNYEPRTAGILLFSENPTPLLSKRCGIKINRYNTDAEIPEREHLKEQFTIEGCLYEQIQRAGEKITEIIETYQYTITLFSPGFKGLLSCCRCI